MAKNIEIKARINSIQSMIQKLIQLADQGPIDIFQDDTYFVCTNDRLKLREFSQTQGELIFYIRENSYKPKESVYVIAPTSDPCSLRRVLSLAYTQCGRICKNRTLFFIGRTRIHLDRVKGLGDFLEIEVVLAEDESKEAGLNVAYDLINQLTITSDQLIAESYIDMLNSSH
jgi:predicted adenylyl cyclase CyaB